MLKSLKFSKQTTLNEHKHNAQKKVSERYMHIVRSSLHKYIIRELELFSGAAREPRQKLRAAIGQSQWHFPATNTNNGAK